MEHPACGFVNVIVSRIVRRPLENPRDWILECANMSALCPDEYFIGAACNAGVWVNPVP